MRKLRLFALTVGVGVIVTLIAPAVPQAVGSPLPPPPSAPAPSPVQRTASQGATASYVVHFRSDTDARTRTAVTRSKIGLRSTRSLTSAPVVQARLTAAEAAQFANDPAVALVEKDVPVQIADSETAAPWGLDRIDQSALPLDNTYTANQTGAGVTVYIIDTGINNHADLAGRVVAGQSWVNDGLGTADCHGHGTHVAGTVGGTTLGVAKQVTLVPVRVLDCEGSGSAFITAQAIDWITRQHKGRTPAVANLSLSGGYSKLMDKAVKRLIADGVTVVVAAGNEGQKACDFSPAGVRKALTVAASDRNDARAGFSNYGSCVDLYAPGVDILSATGDANDTSTMSGTSMAAPHVAGAAALVLAEHPRWSPAKVSAEVLRLSARGRISGNRAKTPNRSLNIAPSLEKVNPPAGPLTGGRTLTITGRGLKSVSRIMFDGVPGTKLKVKSDTRLTVRAPAQGTERAVSITATTPLSSSNGSLQFSYAPTKS